MTAMDPVCKMEVDTDHPPATFGVQRRYLLLLRPRLQALIRRGPPRSTWPTLSR